VNNNSLVERFESYVSEQLPELEGASIAIACSGGLDSVVLTHLSAGVFHLPRLYHINYGLRGEESAGDESFLRELSDSLGLPLRVERVGGAEGLEDLPGSVQMKAREFRYNRFARWSAEDGVEYVLTAHHLEDSLESLLLNLSRGTGLRGLLGVPLRRGIYRRPLLFARRQDLSDYARERNIQWREDSSNQEELYRRNYLRHRVVPLLEGLHPEFWKRIRRSLELLNHNQEWQDGVLDDLRSEVFTKDGIHTSVDLRVLQSLPQPEFLWFELFSPYGFTEPRAIEDLLKASPGKRLESDTHILFRDRGRLMICPNDRRIFHRDATTVSFWNEHEERVQRPLRLHKYRVDSLGEHGNHLLYADLDKLAFPLWIRKWRDGDYFYPFGMNGRKKVAKFLKDEHIPYAEKSQVYVLGSGDRIVWIIGLRPDERFKVDANTQNIICVKYIR